MSGAPIEQWPGRIELRLREIAGPLQRITVLRETDSTQDAARRLGARPGDVIAAWRQVAGRGRLGRTWADTAEHGVALTCVVQRQPPERLAIAAAVGTAMAAESILNRPVGIKWPNDIVLAPPAMAAAAPPDATARRGKLAGILIEQSDQVALIGIGMNVSQRAWPAELALRAVSLAQAGGGADVDRLDVVLALVEHLTRALACSDDQLAKHFRQRDVLVGCQAAFRLGERTIQGTVMRIDPMRGLLVDSSGQGEMWLPAAMTSVIADA